MQVSKTDSTIHKKPGGIRLSTEIRHDTVAGDRQEAVKQTMRIQRIDTGSDTRERETCVLQQEQCTTKPAAIMAATAAANNPFHSGSQAAQGGRAGMVIKSEAKRKYDTVRLAFTYSIEANQGHIPRATSYAFLLWMMLGKRNGASNAAKTSDHYTPCVWSTRTAAKSVQRAASRWIHSMTASASCSTIGRIELLRTAADYERSIGKREMRTY